MEDFFGFLESLENSNQEHLANTLRKGMHMLFLWHEVEDYNLHPMYFNE